MLPFGVVLLWLLYESIKEKALLLAGLAILSIVCMFFDVAYCPSREYPWDCMVEHMFSGALVPFFCLLGYVLYVFLCTCIPAYRKIWKWTGFIVLGCMSLTFEYVNVSFSVMLLAGYLFRYIVRRKFRPRIPVIRKCHSVLALAVVPGICLAGIVYALLFPPPESFICEKVKREMDRDMVFWNYQKNLVLLSCRFLKMERGKDGIIVKYYCETNMGSAVYKAFCNSYGGYMKAECSLLKK